MEKEKILRCIKKLNQCDTLKCISCILAKWTLIHHKDSSFDALITALNDPDQKIVAQVIRILEEMKDTRAIPHLLALTKRNDLWGNTSCVLGRALIKLGEQEGIIFLRNAILDPNNHRDFRIDAAKTLINLKVKNAFNKKETINNTNANMPAKWAETLKKLVNQLT